MKQMKSLPAYRRQRGFTITELMLVLGVGAVIIAGAFTGYKVVSESNDDQQNMSATTNLLASVKNKWSGIGSYTGVSDSAVNAAGLVVKPLTWDGTNIKNVYSHNIVFSTQAANFAGQISVPTNKCIDTIGALDGIAYRIDVHTAGVAANAVESATQTVKAAGGSIDATKATTQCGGATTVVTAFVK